MRTHLSRGGTFAVVLAFVAATAADTAFGQLPFPTLIRNYVPPVWQAADVRWTRDQRPHNKIDDTIDESNEDSFEVIINYKHCLEEQDIEKLKDLNPNIEIQMRSRYIASVFAARLTKEDLKALAEFPEVAFIEEQHEFELHLNVSVPAICVTAGPCSPNTVQEAFPAIDGSGVNIAIIDSGVDDGVHDTLPAGRFVAGYNAVTHVFENPNDNLFHGTHVASIAMGQAGAVVSRGVAPGAGLIDVKLTDTPTFPPTRICEALETVYDNRAAWNVGVINMSLGSPVSSDGTEAICQLVDLAESMGIVVVVSSGNSGPGNVGLGAPGSATRAITVAAVETMNTSARGDDGIACFSSRGARASDGDADTLDELKPEVCAPGTHVDVAVPTCMGGAGTGINAARWNTANGAIRLEGTSMAAPHVAGLAALILHARPGANPASVKDLIIATATPIGPASMPAVDPIWNNASGWGQVNGFAALNVAVQTDLSYPSHPPSPGWLSPDITTVPFPPKVGMPATVTVMVTNRGAAAANAARIHFGVHVFSAATPTFQDIGTRIVNIPPFTAMPVSIAWTPQNASHQCLKAEIGFGADTDYSNNNAQRNVTVQMSPVTFTVANTLTEEPATIRLEPRFEEPNQEPWPFELTQRQFVLAAGDCPQEVQVELFPPADAPPGAHQTLHLAAVMDTPFGPVTLGGVTVMASNRPPELKIEWLRDGRVRICWPSPSTGYTLQSALSLSPLINWRDVEEPVEIMNGMKCVTVNPTEAKRFFRLRSGCAEFGGHAPGTVPNPWTIGGFTFNAHDANGGSRPSGSLQTAGKTVGLDAGFLLEVELPEPCRRVAVTLLRQASADVAIRGYNETNGLIASETLVGAPAGPETVTLDGGDQLIARIVIEPPQDETLLLKVCCLEEEPAGDFFNPFGVPVDGFHEVHEVLIDENGLSMDYDRTLVPADAFTMEPFPVEPKQDDFQPPVPTKVSPILQEWLDTRDPNEVVELLLTFREDMRIPLLPDLMPGEDREEPDTRRGAIIRNLSAARLSSQQGALQRLREYVGNGFVEPIESFWIVNSMRVQMPLFTVRTLRQSPDVVYLQPVVGNEEPPADGNPDNDTIDARALIVSDPYYNLGLTQPWIGLLDTGIRPTHVMFNSPDHIAWLRDCVNGGPNCNNTSNPGYDPTDFAWNHGTCSAAILTGNDRLGGAFRGVTAVRTDSWQIYRASGLDSGAAVRAIQAGVAAFDKVLVGEIQANETETGAIATAADNAYDAGVIFVSANGNFGPDSATVRSPGIAHKVLGVGGFFTDGLGQYNNQGRGPANDGRYKPDIQAPTWSETASSSSDNAMKVFTGTSGATPYAAASAMLARNWLRTFGIYDNGQTYAFMILYGQNTWPYNNTVGAGPIKMAVNGHAWWGKVVVLNGGTINIPIGVGSGRRNFNGALWWPESAAQSHNDIDLHLIDPSGTERARGYSGVSVFERAGVAGSLTPGTWTVRIRGYRVRTFAQVVYWAATVNN